MIELLSKFDFKKTKIKIIMNNKLLINRTKIVLESEKKKNNKRKNEEITKFLKLKPKYKTKAKEINNPNGINFKVNKNPSRKLKLRV